MRQCYGVLLTLIGYLATFCLGNVFKYVGCYPKDELTSKLSYQDTFMYQSRGHCQDVCGGTALLALTGGDRCYCGNDAKVLNGLKQASDSACSTGCMGIDTEMCGGSRYFSILVNYNNIDDLTFEPGESGGSGGSSSTTSSTTSSSLTTTRTSTSSRSSSTTTSSTSSTTTSSTSSTTTSSTSSTTTSSTSSTSSLPTSAGPSTTASNTEPAAASTSSATSSTSQDTEIKDTTSISVQVSTDFVTPSTSTFTTDKDQGLVVITTTFFATGSTSASSSSANSATSAGSSSRINAPSNKKSNHMSKGAIAGIVIGVVGAIVLIAIFILLWRRRRTDDDVSSPFNESHLQHQPYSLGHNEDLGPAIPQAAAANSYHKNSSGNGYPEAPYPRASNGQTYGRPRLSNHSLPDITENQTLRITNPDSI